MRSFLIPLIIFVLAALPAQSGELPKQVRDILNRDRGIRAGMYDSFDSSVLGKTASPAETAATQRNWREYYGKPARQLPETLRNELAKKYGNIKVFGEPRSNSTFPLGIVGARVADADGRPELTVTAVTDGTPAAGKLMVDDVIIGANGWLFPEWEDPRVPMGYVIAAAQTKAHNGRMTLHVGRDGRIVDVVLSLPVGTPYDTSRPFACERSREIAAKAVDAVINNGDDTFFMDLFLMGCGDARAVALVKDRMRKLEVSESINNNWGPAYKLISLCEYYLLTGDNEVLPKIETLVRGLEKTQLSTGGWGHTPKFGYGYMNQLGQTALIGMTLANECGIVPDANVYSKGIGQLTRFIGTYSAYGDHLPGVSRYNGAGSDNGVMSAHAVLFQLLGEPDIARRSARRTCYLYRSRTAGHGERIFAIAWGAMGPNLAPKAEQAMYANNMLWYYELARQRDGSLRNPALTRYSRNTAAVGMCYTLADKRLRISGKAKGTAPLFPVDELPPPPPAAPAKGSPKPVPAVAKPKMVWDTSTVTIQPVTSATEMAETVFTCKGDPKQYTQCTVTLPASMAGELWLNGSCVAVFPAPAKQELQSLQLGARATSLLKQGENRWALKCGASDKPTKIEVSFAPAQGNGSGIKVYKADYCSWRKTNGWKGTYRQHQEGVAWAFEGKTPKEIARYLAYPDAAGAHAAYKALAAGGDQALALCKKLVTDSHAGIRVGAWDALAEMHKTQPLDAETCRTLANIAIAQLANEDPCVGMPLIKALEPMATVEELAKVISGVARLNDPLARSAASQAAKERLKGRPDLQIPALIPFIEAKLNNNDIRTLGDSMRTVSSYAKTDIAAQALPAIAGVLDEVAPDTRGMFTDTLMHGGLLTVEHHLSPATEKTPQLVSGLSKCFIKVPETDWPGWAYASVFFRRLIYRLTASSAETIRITAIESQNGEKPNGIGQSPRREAELLAWADVLKRTGGDAEKLKQEALRLVRSNSQEERTVALSLVWPSQRALKIQSTRYSEPKDVPDTSRIEDAEVALEVALEAAKKPELNRSIDWYMIWLTVNKYGTDKSADTSVELAADYLADLAFRVRPDAFHFQGIDQALLAMEKYAAPERALARVGRGLAKAYATCPTNQTETEKKLKTLLGKMGPDSRQGITQGISEVEAWLKAAPKEERGKVLNRYCKRRDVDARLKELKKLAEKK